MIVIGSYYYIRTREVTDEKLFKDFLFIYNGEKLLRSHNRVTE